MRRKTNIPLLAAVAAMIVAACGRARTNTPAQTPRPTIQTTPAHRIDSLVRLLNNTRDAVAKTDAAIAETNAGADGHYAHAGRIFSVAVAEYWARLDREYTMVKYMPASDILYYSHLARRILANADTRGVIIGISSATDVLGPDDAYFGAPIRVDPVAAIRRVASGTGAVRDVAIMVHATAFSRLGLNGNEWKELKKYVALGQPRNSLRNAGSATAKCWAACIDQYISANADCAEYVIDGRSITARHQNEIYAKIQRLMARNPVPARYIQKLQQEYDDLAWVRNTRIDEINEAARGTPVNFTIPELDAVRTRYMREFDTANKIVARSDSLGTVRDSLQNEITKYLRELALVR